MDEWDYLDGGHTTESISYLAATPGTHDLGGVKIVAKAVTNVNHEWKTVNYGSSVSNPVLLATQVTNAGGACTTVRTRSVGGSSSQIRLQEEEAADGTHANETVHYMVLSSGTGALSGKALRVGKTPNNVTHVWKTINYGGTYQNPHFLANMQTYDGPDPAALRFRNKGNTSVQVFTEEEQSGDSETAHTTEVVGYVVIGQNAAALQADGPSTVKSSVDQFKQDADEFTAFPNPFQTELHSQFTASEQERRIYLLDVSGRVLEEQVVLPGQERASFAVFDLDLGPGMYLVRLLSEDKSITRKVMKLR
ncbi:MAG: T9SS type A sorting domain-containing protein [Bacteroidota bacterium]